MRHPETGALECTPAGVLGAQVAHTKALGSQAAYFAANPAFDAAFRAEVTAAVPGYSSQVQADGGADGHALSAPITLDEVAAALRTLKNGRAASPATGIPNELLKYGGEQAARLLLPLFAAVWEAGRPPDEWREGVIQYFHKSGAKDDMANYRGITLLDVISKLFHSVLATRLLRHDEDNNLLHDAQNAFRPGRSADEHIFSMTQVAQGGARLQAPGAA
jgi:hypothetical protein